MKLIQICSSGLLLLVSTVGCKQSGDSSMSAASRSSAPEAEACQLSESQAKLLSTAIEYSSLQKIELTSLAPEERAAVSAKRNSKSCDGAELSTLGESFPSIASKLPGNANDNGDATALALGGAGMGGTSGVVRTDYILIPGSGTRYVAGYNSAGDIIHLIRLIQTRSR